MKTWKLVGTCCGDRLQEPHYAECMDVNVG